MSDYYIEKEQGNYKVYTKTNGFLGTAYSKEGCIVLIEEYECPPIFEGTLQELKNAELF